MSSPFLKSKHAKKTNLSPIEPTSNKENLMFIKSLIESKKEVVRAQHDANTNKMQLKETMRLSLVDDDL